MGYIETGLLIPSKHYAIPFNNNMGYIETILVLLNCFCFPVFNNNMGYIETQNPLEYR